MKKYLVFCIYGELRLFKETCITYNTLLKEISKEYDILFIINSSLTATIVFWKKDVSEQYKKNMKELSVFTQDELKECMDNLTKDITPLNKIIKINEFENIRFNSIHDKIINYKLDIIDIINNYSKEHNINFDKVFITRSDIYFEKLDIGIMNKDLYANHDFWLLLSGHIIKNDVFKKDIFYSKQEIYIKKLHIKANSIIKHLNNLLNINKEPNIPTWFIENICIKHFTFQIICYYELEISYEKDFNFKDFEFENFFIQVLINYLKKNPILSFNDIHNYDNIDKLLENIKKSFNELEQTFHLKHLPFQNSSVNLTSIFSTESKKSIVYKLITR